MFERQPGLILCILVGICLSLLVACGQNSQGSEKSPVFHATDNPKLLSEWNLLFSNKKQLHINSDTAVYDLNTPLFSDYAHKLRTVWVPDGAAIQYKEDEAYEFPVSSIISKTFYYAKSDDVNNGVRVFYSDPIINPKFPDSQTSNLDLKKHHLVETRLLVRRAQGWVALPYVWNAEQTDAVLKRTGDIQAMTLQKAGGEQQDFNYIVPDANQCAGCHATNATTREILPIGIKTRHLNKENQLADWQQRGLLTGLPKEQDQLARNANWQDVTSSLDERARAYLDINCSHCHNAVGPADTSGLLLEPQDPYGPSLGVCKLPIAAGTGTGDREFSIVPGEPDDSIMLFRMQSTEPAVMMPELGRSLQHKEGVELIAQWVASLEGDCE